MNFNDKDTVLFDAVERGMARHPRSLQRMIGPSGIGHPCDIWLTYSLAKHRESRVSFSGWKATVGTAVHAWMEKTFTAENEELGYRRWLTEQEVMVGQIGGEDVWGSSDLFDTFTKTVYDWKFVGPTMLKKYKSNGPSDQYRMQAHLYGQGFANNSDAFGIPKEVAIAFVPRDGEISQSYVWREPWDASVAAAGLERANRLYRRLFDEFDGDPVAASVDLPTCDEFFCGFCNPQVGGLIFGH